MCDIVLY